MYQGILLKITWFKQSYRDRLNVVCLELVELLRRNTDLIILYKLLHKNIDCNVHNIFTFNRVLNTKSQAYKLAKLISRLDSKKFSFSFRVINVWNFLSNISVYCSTVTQFVYKLKQFYLSSFIRGQTFI